MSDKGNATAIVPSTPPPPRSELDRVAGDRTALRRPFWIVDGVAYDFTDWMVRHPGGAAWFGESVGRDISTLFHTYHLEPQRLRKLLDKYRIDEIGKKDVIPNMGLPQFLLPDGFDAKTDLPEHDFGRGDDLRSAIVREVGERVPPRRLRRHDLAFDAISASVFLLHVAAMCALVFGALSPVACVMILVLTRTSLAGAGHFYLHRKKPAGGASRREHGELPSVLFDFNYIGTHLVGVDGHVILHHPYLGSGGDIKVAFLAGMRRLHPFLRFLGYTFQKLGMCLFGSTRLGALIIFSKHARPGMRVGFWLGRVWLLAELIACLASGQLVAWLSQFILTLWFNTLLVAASHDFENVHRDDPIGALPEHLRSDWAARQICLSYDLRILGNRWVDVFLSAGLNTHRVHHVLPFQRSGFANIVSEDAVRKVCEEAGIRWERPKHLITERLPAFLRHYLFSPAPAAHEDGKGRLSAAQELGMLVHYILRGWRTGAD